MPRFVCVKRLHEHEVQALEVVGENQEIIARAIAERADDASCCRDRHRLEFKEYRPEVNSHRCCW